jgi:fibronectin type III domain protein
MTYPEATGHGLPAASVPGGPGAPGPPPGTQGPTTVAPHRRRRWVWFTLVAVLVVAGLAAGLVVWAPWKAPPVLRPAGLVTGPATANSITFRWARPHTGPLPDKYLILSDGRVAGTVAGTATSYRQAGLTPASTYQYRVVAVRGGTRSPQSRPLAVSTLVPPMSEARLQGPWNVSIKYIRHASNGYHGRNGTLFWDFLPACATGACGGMLHVRWGKHSFKLTLARAGAGYQGHATVNFIPCGTAGNSIPDPTTLKFRVRATDAVGESQVWAATSLAGTMVGTSKYVSSATFYCPAGSFKSTLSGIPS